MTTGRTSRTAVAIRHVAFEDLGVFEPFLREHGFDVRYLDAPDVPAAEVYEADLLVVLGAPISADDPEHYPFLTEEMDAIRNRHDGGRPTIGVCLGAQLMAAAIGGQVTRGPRKEIGFGPLSITDAGMGGALRHLVDVPVLHWHGDTFTLPTGVLSLASTPGYPNQAFQQGASLGLQFHIEADWRRIERWLIGHAHELETAGFDVREIRADAERFGPALTDAATTMFGEWLAEMGLAGTSSSGG